jgi:hypothetical protein
MQTQEIQENPDWLTGAPSQLLPTQSPISPVSPVEHRRVTKELLDATFSAMFERVLSEMTQGRTLKSIVSEDLRSIEYDAFWRWIKRDPQRYERYKEAKELRTEWWAGRIIEIAEAEDAAEDVQRSKLKIDTYKWLMGADNRKQYGDIKQVEIAQSISITAALEQARSRVLMNVEEAVDYIEHKPTEDDN